MTLSCVSWTSQETEDHDGTNPIVNWSDSPGDGGDTGDTAHPDGDQLGHTSDDSGTVPGDLGNDPGDPGNGAGDPAQHSGDDSMGDPCVAVDETCDTVDNNCNGQVDEGCDVIALIALLEDTTAAISQIQANAGWVSVYQQTVNVAPGDILRLRGQAEVTNDNPAFVRAHLRIAIDGVHHGTQASQNVVRAGGHHMPLWVDAVHEPTTTRASTISVQLAASRSGTDPILLVENGYGHLSIEHYRPFVSRHEAASMGALGLKEWAHDRQANVTTFGGTFAERALPYDVTLSLSEDDVVRLLAQSTSRWHDDPIEMHGLGIFLGPTKLGPWATENTPWAIQTVPLFTDAVYTATAGAMETFTVSMHGVAGHGDEIVWNGGHLFALVFRPLRNMTDALGAKGLIAVTVADGPTADTLIQTNSGAHTLAEAPVAVAGASAIARVTGFTQLSRAGSYALGISCTIQTEWANAGGQVIESSAISTKYITVELEHLPLRTELVSSFSSPGTYTARLKLTCSRGDANPDVMVLGGRTALLVEVFSPMP